MDLKNMVLPEKVVTFSYPGLDGLEFDLAFISKEVNQDIIKKCTRQKWDTRSKSTVEELDEDEFMQVYSGKIVQGWRGFKASYLNEFLATDTSKYDEDAEVDYTPENALVLMTNSSVFDNWVSEKIRDIKNFTNPDLKENLKKSKNISKSPDPE